MQVALSSPLRLPVTALPRAPQGNGSCKLSLQVTEEYRFLPWISTHTRFFFLTDPCSWRILVSSHWETSIFPENSILPLLRQVQTHSFLSVNVAIKGHLINSPLQVSPLWNLCSFLWFLCKQLSQWSDFIMEEFLIAMNYHIFPGRLSKCTFFIFLFILFKLDKKVHIWFLIFHLPTQFLFVPSILYSVFLTLCLLLD